MANKDRKRYIVHIALAIHHLSRHGDRNAEKISWFAEVIIRLAEMPDDFIANNREQIDSVFHEAQAIHK